MGVDRLSKQWESGNSIVATLIYGFHEVKSRLIDRSIIGFSLSLSLFSLYIDARKRGREWKKKKNDEIDCSNYTFARAFTIQKFRSLARKSAAASQPPLTSFHNAMHSFVNRNDTAGGSPTGMASHPGKYASRVFADRTGRTRGESFALFIDKNAIALFHIEIFMKNGWLYFKETILHSSAEKYFYSEKNAQSLLFRKQTEPSEQLRRTKSKNRVFLVLRASSRKDEDIY